MLHCGRWLQGQSEVICPGSVNICVGYLHDLFLYFCVHEAFALCLFFAGRFVVGGALLCGAHFFFLFFHARETVF